MIESAVKFFEKKEFPFVKVKETEDLFIIYRTTLPTGSVAYGNLAIDRDRFTIITSNSKEQDLKELLKNIRSLAPQDKERLKQDLKCFSLVERKLSLHDLNSKIEDIKLTSDIDVVRFSTELFCSKRDLTRLKEEFLDQMAVLDGESAHVKLLERFLESQSSPPSIEKWEIEIFEAYIRLGFANEKNQREWDRVGAMARQYGKDNWLMVCSRLFTRALQNKKHPYHSLIVTVLKGHRLERTPLESTVSYLKSQDVFSNSLLRYAGILPPVEKAKMSLKKKFQKEEKDLVTKIKAEQGSLTKAWMYDYIVNFFAYLSLKSTK